MRQKMPTICLRRGGSKARSTGSGNRYRNRRTSRAHTHVHTHTHTHIMLTLHEKARRTRLERVAQKVQTLGSPYIVVGSSEAERRPSVAATSSAFRGRASIAIPAVKPSYKPPISGEGAGATDGAETEIEGGTFQLVDDDRTRGRSTVEDTAVEQVFSARSVGPTDDRQGTNHLVCPQCAGAFTAAHTDFAPKLLPCFHSVCATCALDLKKFKGPGRRCPVCREAVGFADLVDDFVALDLLAARQLESARYALMRALSVVHCATESLSSDEWILAGMSLVRTSASERMPMRRTTAMIVRNFSANFVFQCTCGSARRSSIRW